MGELLLAHGGEIHGIPPFAILFLAVLVMGIGLGVAVKAPPRAGGSRTADHRAEDEESSKNQ